MAGRTVVGTGALERAIRRMEGQIEGIKNRMGGDGGSVFGGAYDPAGTAAAAVSAHAGTLSHATLDSYLDQAVKQASSPAFVTVKCSGLTDAYIPYHVSDAVGFANTGMTWNAVDKRLSIYGTNSFSTLGAELVTDGDFGGADLSAWGSPANWSLSSGTALHATGATAALTQNINIVSGKKYYIAVTMAGRTAGSIAIAIGTVSVIYSGASGDFIANGTVYRSFVGGATGALTLTITPTSTFDGSIDDVVIKEITAGAGSPLTIYDDAATSMGTIRGSGSPSNNIAQGASAFAWLTAGAVGNTSFGISSSAALTNGQYNAAYGYTSMAATTTGTRNVAFGYQSLYLMTTGWYNCAFGGAALRSLTNGTGNVALGYSAGYFLTTGINNIHIGNAAGYAYTSNAPVTDTYGILIGYAAVRSVVSATVLTNYIGIGKGVSIGKDNQAIFGNTSIVETRLFGNVAIGSAGTSDATIFGSSAAKVVGIWTGTAPTSAPADMFQMYSKDIAAGEAAPHFMTEHGDIIKLYQRAHVADPSGGATVDAEARTAINAILSSLENLGFHATA
jgi:hypothetical protein